MSILCNAKTPIVRCELKSLYMRTMIGKFPEVDDLKGLDTKLELATTTLLERDGIYREKIKSLVVIRVEIKFTDRLADQAIRAAIRRAQIADGKAGGLIASTLFPGGSTPVIRPVGGTQVKEMRALEGRYVEAAQIYPAGADDHGKIKELRVRYEDALEARKLGMEAAAQARAARNLAKEEFLDIFAEVVHRIRGAFPRDKKTQDLFFLKDKGNDGIDVGDDQDDETEDDAGSEGIEALG